LAENKRDENRPFAFLATFATGLSESGRPQHRPLGAAVRESAEARDRSSLLRLLEPVERAAQESALLRELVDSRALFSPQRWTADQAYRFLKEVPAFEAAGLLVRVPDWWRRRARPQVAVRVGQSAPSTLGVDALLDFQVGLALDGEPLTAAELRAIRAQTSGLQLIRGRWVEVESEKLVAVLASWKDIERSAKTSGLAFGEALRLLSGASLDGDRAPAEERDWTEVVAGSWLKERLASLRRPESASDDGEIAGLKAVLRPYQRAGVAWLRLLSEFGLGACLADDMGLGKTVQVIALVLALKRARGSRTHVLVAPASLLGNWLAELERFAPTLRAQVVHPSAGPEAMRAPTHDALLATDLVITTYGTVTRLEWLSEQKWDLVILDEAQAVKTPSAKQTRAVKALPARARIALTGTPVENRLGDLWSIFDFLNPGLLGSAKAFSQLTRRLADKGDYGPLKELCRPYLLRRLKTDRNIIADLPEKTEVRAYAGLTKVQAALYEDAVRELEKKLTKLAVQRGASGDGQIARRGAVLAALLRFKQICNHPSQWLSDGAYAPEASGKFARLAELCEPIREKQEKVLVFTQFREITDALAAFLARTFGRAGLVLHGGTPVKERCALVERFQSEESVPFFVLSVKAGGTGLNLTAASHVIHFDRWWNPAVEDQATDRAFRIGQKRAVLVHKLVCRGTVEERIDALIEQKRGLQRQLLEGGGEIDLGGLDDRELLSLVSLDIHAALDGA
jgi:non-specific serine/threonine protein kinase